MKFKKGTILELEIHDFAYGGKGIHRAETESGRYVVFVLNAIPGQIVRAKVQKKRKKYAEWWCFTVTVNNNNNKFALSDELNS